MKLRLLLASGVIFLLVLMSETSASEWKFVKNDRDMCPGESFVTKEYTLLMVDRAKDAEGQIIACMFDVYKEGVKIDTVIAELGTAEEFADGQYKVTLLKGNKGCANCFCDVKVRPYFRCSSTTSTLSSYNKTVIYAKLETAKAQDVKVKWILQDVSFKGSKPISKQYANMSVGENFSDVNIKWTSAKSIQMQINYKGADGTKYTQTYNVLQNSVVEEVKGVKTEVKDKTISTYKVSPAKTATEKKIFKAAINRAIKYIEFSAEDKADLERVLTKL